MIALSSNNGKLMDGAEWRLPILEERLQKSEVGDHKHVYPLDLIRSGKRGPSLIANKCISSEHVLLKPLGFGCFLFFHFTLQPPGMLSI